MNPDRIKLLIVEDHLITRLGLRVALEEHPDLIVVDEAENGEEAVEKIMGLAPDIVLLDIGLPKIDGIECLIRVKARKSLSRILMTTSHEEPASIISALAAGADGYCLKDSGDRMLLQGIHSLARGRAWLDPRVAGQLLAVFTRGGNSRSFETSAELAQIVLPEKDMALLDQIAHQTSIDRPAQEGLEFDRLRGLFRTLGDLTTTNHAVPN